MVSYGLQLDTTASDISATGTALAAGNTLKAADAGHVHTGLSLITATSLAGYALVNGTGTIISWAVPNDGKLHRFMVFASMDIATTETGGTIAVVFTSPGNSPVTYGIMSPGQAAGWNFSIASFPPTFAKAGTTVSVSQSTALTAGSATMQAEIWGA
jgi:hypothetical protein